MSFVRFGFYLVARGSGYVGFTGHKLRGLFLGLLKRDLAGRLHGSVGNRPAVYGILPLRPRDNELCWDVMFDLKIKEGGEYVFDVSMPMIFAEEVLDILLDRPGVEVRIGNVEFVLREIVVDFLALRRLGLSDVFIIDFLTPTFFKSVDRLNNVLLPLPELVVSSAVRLWNSFVANRDEYNSEFLKKQAMRTIRITRHRIWTAPPVRLKKGRKVLGFLGTVTYQVVDSEMKELLAKLLAVAQIMNIGNGRTMGFGVIRIRNSIEQKADRKLGTYFSNSTCY